MVDPTAPGPSSLHGVPLISTPATAAATAWVIEASGVTIFRRGPLSVQVGTNADDLAHNTARWWLRSGSALRSPGRAA